MTTTIEESAPYLLGVEVTDNSANQHTAAQPPAKAPRARRSDYGTKKPPKVPAEATGGALVQPQAYRLRSLLEDVVQAEREYWEADARRAKAGIAYNAFIESLTTKS